MTNIDTAMAVQSAGILEDRKKIMIPGSETDGTVVIHQPDFLPWLGFFEKWRKSDVYVVLDDVQYLRRGWQNRDKIKTSKGVQWLTVPVKKKGRFHQQIREVEIDYQPNWRKKHLETIKAAYLKAPCFDRVYSSLEDIYDHAPRFLMELNINCLEWAAYQLGIETPKVLASSFEIEATSTQRLVELVRAVKGRSYLTGHGARDYLEEEIFSEAGLRVVWHDFQHPVYPQLHGKFEAELSILDYLMMGGGKPAAGT